MPRSGGRSSSRGRSSFGGGYGRSYSPYGSGAYRYSPKSGSAYQSRGSTSSAYTRPPVNNTANTTTTRTMPMGMGGGLGSTIAHGMAFGAGSSIAHHTLGGLFGSRQYAQPSNYDPYQENPMTMDNNTGQIQQSQQAMEEQNRKLNPCYDDSKRFVECMTGVDDISKCQSLFDELKSCEKRLGNNI
jgi:hypothetical protein